MKARRLAFCRRCNRESAQAYLSTERPGVEIWRCQCSAVLMSLGDISDADGFAAAIADTWIRRSAIVPSEVDREEVYAEARAGLWACFLKWDPDRGVPLRSYASWKTSSLLTDWIRAQRGRTYGDDHSGLKPHADALSLDTPDLSDSGSSRLDSLVSASARDPATDRSTNLSRALERRGGDEPREERGVGSPAYARAS